MPSLLPIDDASAVRLWEADEVFIVQEGVLVDDPWDDVDSAQCPVCQSWNDVPGCCSVDCYRLWTAMPEDPREGGWL